MPYSVHVERGVPVHEHTRKQYASGKKHPKKEATFKHSLCTKKYWLSSKLGKQAHHAIRNTRPQTNIYK